MQRVFRSSAGTVELSVVVFELDVVPGEVAVSSANGKISMEFGARENMQLLGIAYLVA